MDIIKKQEMINIKQEFYDTFGIEKRCIRPKDCVRKGICRGAVACDFYTYPEITERILLEMICIILNAEGLLTINAEGNITDIKDFVLRFLIDKVNKNNPYCHYKTKNKIKHQIQQLFKGDK